MGNDMNTNNEKSYDIYGFDRDGINKDTGTKYDKDGYDREGYDKRGYDREGYSRASYNVYGFDRLGIHRDTGTMYNPKGYDKDGYDREGYDKRGRDREGYSRASYNVYGFDRLGIHRHTGTMYNPKGYDKDGYNKDGYNSEGIDREGYNLYGMNKDGIDKVTGKKSVLVLAVEQYIESGLSVGMYCKKNKIDEEQFRRLLQEIPSMCEKINNEQLREASERSSKIYLQKSKDVLKQIISGEKSFQDYVEKEAKYVNFDKLLAIAEINEQEILNEKLIYAMLEGNLKYKNYINLFTRKGVKRNPHDVILEHVNGVIKLANNNPIFREQVANLYKERRRLQKFTTPVIDREIVGARMSFDHGKTFVEVTEEHLKQAKQYVKDSGEFLCGCTVNEAVRKLLKGEISPKPMSEAQPKKPVRKTELRKLIEEKEMLIKEKEKMSEKMIEKYSSICLQSIESKEKQTTVRDMEI